MKAVKHVGQIKVVVGWGNKTRILDLIKKMSKCVAQLYLLADFRTTETKQTDTQHQADTDFWLFNQPDQKRRVEINL